MPITRETRATVRAAMAASVAAAGLRAGIGMIAGLVATGLRVPAAGAMTSAGRVPVVRRKAGAMSAVEVAATVVEAGAISISSGIAIGSLRLRWCGRLR